LSSRSKSLSEAFVNSFGSYPIGYGASLLILPFFAPLIQKDPFTVNLVITLIYATISFTRIYFLRRFFETHGLNDNLIRLLVPFGRHLRNKIGRINI
jgi:hypothetical protein